MDDRFLWTIIRTLLFTAASVVLPVVLGIRAVLFRQQLSQPPGARTVYFCVADDDHARRDIAARNQIFHSQLEVLNDLLSLFGLPPSSWVYDSTTVIPMPVMVETGNGRRWWCWSPLPDPAVPPVPVARADWHADAADPDHLYSANRRLHHDRLFRGPGDLEAAAPVDGATIWQAFRYVAMPLARPGATVAMILAFIFSWNNFIFGMVPAGRPTPCRSHL